MLFKRIAFFLALIIPASCLCQTKAPTNVHFTVNEISGNADPKTVIKINRNVGAIVGQPIITVAVNMNGYFEYTFETPLPVISGPPVLQPTITLWAEDDEGNQSTQVNYTALIPSFVLQGIRNGTVTLPSKINNPEIDGIQTVSTTFKYKVKMLNTNFTIPLARFNFITDNSNSKRGEILLFNSVGAGIGVSWGEIEKTTDATGATINTDFTNTFGIHLGVLFSAGKDGSEQKNIFAPTVSLSVLDFQLGFGYELGTTIDIQKKGFLTLAYAIPLSKLVKGKYYIFRASKGFNSKHPLPAIPPGERRTASVKRFI
jgi:hypothetical protein